MFSAVVKFGSHVSWMAPEALREGKCTVFSDVWSFGVVLWEIWTYATLPYASYTNQEVFEGVTDSTDSMRLPQPSGCPNAIYRLMKEVGSFRLILFVPQPNIQYLMNMHAFLCSVLANYAFTPPHAQVARNRSERYLTSPIGITSRS